MGHIAASEEMSFERIRIDGDAGLHRCHPAIDNQANRNSAEAHSDELGEGDGSVRQLGAEPGPKKIQEDYDDHQSNNEGCGEEKIDGKLRNHKRVCFCQREDGTPHSIRHKNI